MLRNCASRDMWNGRSSWELATSKQTRLISNRFRRSVLTRLKYTTLLTTGIATLISISSDGRNTRTSTHRVKASITTEARKAHLGMGLLCSGSSVVCGPFSRDAVLLLYREHGA